MRLKTRCTFVMIAVLVVIMLMSFATSALAAPVDTRSGAPPGIIASVELQPTVVPNPVGRERNGGWRVIKGNGSVERTHFVQPFMSAMATPTVLLLAVFAVMLLPIVAIFDARVTKVLMILCVGWPQRLQRPSCGTGGGRDAAFVN